MYHQESDKAPVTFQDVAAYFSEEEWKLLHEWQKELYRNVMKDIQQALMSLGPLIAASIFSLRAEDRKCRSPGDHEITGRRFRTVSPRLPFLDGNIPLGSEEEPRAMYIENLDMESTRNITSPSSDQVIATSVVSFQIKEEREHCSIDHPNLRKREHTDSPAGDDKTKPMQSKTLNPGIHAQKTKSCETLLKRVDFEVVQNPEEGTNSRNQLWPQNIHELEVKEIPQLESRFSNSTKGNLQHETITGEESSVYDECENNLRNAAHSTCLSQMDQIPGHYMCTEYDQQFNQEGEFLRLNRAHTDMRPYACTDCDKSFSRKGDLNRHRTIHTGEKPFTCSECHKSFNRKYNLNEHRRIHTEERRNQVRTNQTSQTGCPEIWKP
ncbi:zinc finger protein 19-like isoform X1 [Pleurodeles waltl]|uniref:zinc finger protein 19-like isoform X1 n=1 Tax=Pleurodeles waltl TaxID=8319 RepID=UPI003709C45D